MASAADLLKDDLWERVVIVGDLQPLDAARLACAGRLFNAIVARQRAAGLWKGLPRISPRGWVQPPWDNLYFEEVVEDQAGDLQVVVDRCPSGMALKLQPGEYRLQCMLQLKRPIYLFGGNAASIFVEHFDEDVEDLDENIYDILVESRMTAGGLIDFHFIANHTDCQVGVDVIRGNLILQNCKFTWFNAGVCISTASSAIIRQCNFQLCGCGDYEVIQLHGGGLVDSCLIVGQEVDGVLPIGIYIR